MPAHARTAAPSDVLRSVLSDSRLGGALLVGRIGSGRRSTFDNALVGLDPRPAIVHLNGSPFAAQTQYGVLSLLLSQLDTTELISRHALVRAIADMLGDQRTIVTLGSPELIDSESAAVLAQLSTMRKISLVVVCSRPPKLPADLSALHRSGMLVRIEVPGMDIGQTRSFLEAELGGPVSMFTTAALWRMCRASRDLIRRVSREFVAQGRLRAESGMWILSPGAFHISSDIRVPQLAHVTIEERRLLNILAVGGRARLAGLRQCGLAEEASSLRSRGLLTIVEARSETVDIAVPLIAHILRAGLDETHVRDLDRDLAELYADPRIAKVLTAARAMRDLGSDTEAVAAVEEYERAGGFSPGAWRADPIGLSHILEVQFWALVALGRRHDTELFLECAREGLTEAARPGLGDRRLVQAQQHIGLLAAQEAVLGGRHEAVTGLTQVLWETESLHIKALTMQAEASALGARQNEALSIVESVDREMSALQLSGVLDQVLTQEQCAEIECSLVRVRLLCGEWQAAGRAARRLADGLYPAPHAAAYGELVGGLLNALAHETEAALTLLLPAVHQTSAVSAGTIPMAARAAAEYCLADRGREDSLPPAPAPGLPAGGFLWWAGEVLTCLRRARDDTGSAIADLFVIADRCRDTGEQMLEMAALAAALRLGDTTCAGRLELLAAASSAPTARAYLRLARGVAGRDCSALAQGIEELIAHGQFLFSHGEGGVLLECLSHRDRRRILSTRYEDSLDGRAAEAKPADSHPDRAWLAHLTKREAQIADQVISGMTNSEIARANVVSVRTVEGHLYQVYSKLHVRSRQELTALARTHRGK